MREIFIPDLSDMNIMDLLSDEFNFELDLYLQNIKIFVDEITNRVYIIDENNQTKHFGLCNEKSDDKIKEFCKYKIQKIKNK